VHRHSREPRGVGGGEAAERRTLVTSFVAATKLKSRSRFPSHAALGRFVLEELLAPICA